MSNEVEQFIKENPGSSEVENKRNLNSKFFEHFGKMTMHTHLGHIHYKNKNNKKLENVDCKFIPCDYGWEMRKNNYELEIPRKANGWFKFINSFGYDSRGKEQVDRPDEITAIKPLGVSAVSGESITKPEWKGKGIVLYKNAYGQDIDLEVMARNTGFVKEVVINKKPSDLSKDLEFAFEIDLGDKQVKPKKADYMSLREGKIEAFKGLKDKELLAKQKLYEDDLEREVWNKTSKLETSESIILEKLRKTWFRKFNLYDSEGNQGLVKVRLENIDGKIILTKVLDKRFLENAVYPVRTDTTTSYYAGAGDGLIDYIITANQPDQTDWNTAHDANTGIGVDTISSSWGRLRIRILGASNGTYIFRGFFPIDTSGLGVSAVISEAVLKLYIDSKYDDYNGDGYDYVAVVKTFQASTSELVTADYEDCGYDSGNEEGGRAKYLAVKGSTDIDLTGINLSVYNDFTLNEIGRGWINKTGTTMLGVREGHDIQDNWSDPGEVDKNSGIITNFSEQTDTDKDPYLSITYTVSSSSSSSFSSSSSCSSSFSSSSSCSSSFSSSSSCSSSFSSCSSSFSSSSSCSSSFSSSSSCSSSFSSSCSSSFSSSSCSSSFSSSSSCSSSFSSSCSSSFSSSSYSSSFSSSSSCSSSFSSCSLSFSSCSSSFSSSSSCSSSFSSSSSCSSSFSSSSSCSSSFSSCSSSFSSSSSCSSSFSSSCSSLFSSSSSCSSSFSSSSSCSSSFSSSCSSSSSLSSSCSSSSSATTGNFPRDFPLDLDSVEMPLDWV